MISFVKKANNKGRAVSQRDAINKALNSVMKEDGSFDFDRMLREYSQEFSIVVHLVCYQITKNDYYVSPTEVYVRPSSKYESLFLQLEEPIFQAVKRAVIDEEPIRPITYSVESFYLSRAVYSDLPDRLKDKAVSAAKLAHGDDYDIKALKEDRVKLKTILGEGPRSVYFFDINTFKFTR